MHLSSIEGKTCPYKELRINANYFFNYLGYFLVYFRKVLEYFH